jgi:hypothetical protein
MSSIEGLPPDQRAVLELVLRRGRTYDEIAALLSIDRAGVRERALAALDSLGPQTGVPAERRALITDYLLGALPTRVSDDVREHLGDSPSERAWARVVASELGSITSDPLPEIPVESTSRAEAPEAAAEPEPEPAPRRPRPRREPPQRRPKPPREPGSSRTGGAVLLAAGAAVVIAVVLVLVLSGGGSKKHTAAATGSSTSTSGQQSTPKTSTAATKVVAQINLKPPTGGTKPVGIAEVLQEKGKTGIAIVAQGLTPNTKKPPDAYAVWLYNSPTDSRILGFVSPSVGSNGRLQTAGGLPTNASHFQKLLVTRESQSNPKAPGTIVLEGPLSGV